MKKIGGFAVLLMLFAGCATPKKQLNGVPLALPASTEPVELKIPVAGGASVVINPGGHSLSPDGQGWIRWETAGLPDTLHFEAGGRTWSLPTADWKLPYRYAVNADGEVQREWPWLEFRSRVPDTTYQPRLNLLCKSVYPGKAAINGDSVKMYRTGIFFREIALNEGANRVRAEVLGPDGNRATYERKIVYVKKNLDRPAFPLWIDESAMEPAENQVLLSGDVIRLRFTGSKGQKGSMLVQPGKRRLACSRKDFKDYSVYETDLHLNDLQEDKPVQLTAVLEPAETSSKVKPLKMPFKAGITIQNESKFPLVLVEKPKSILSYNLGPIRLGPPIIEEYNPGVVLQSDGLVGEYYRIRLNRHENGFIHRDNVSLLPTGTVRPGYYITTARASGNGQADVVSIPYPEPVAYAVYPEVEQKRIRIALYGVKTSSTWMVHRDGLRVIENLKWEQTTPDTYELYVYLKTPKIWGYDLVRNGSNLELRIKHPPAVEILPDGEVKGLVVSIEAGHGGSNFGAVGLSGLLEKDVNLATALELEKICRAHGVGVVQIRDTDRYMLLSDKRNDVENSGAHIHVSIHANSGGGANYLGTSGVSTYYHNPFWADFAKIMYRHVRELPLKDYGVVGAFNYTVTRIDSRPSILVEQAFLSQAEDEENLADPEFRRQMAEKIFAGMLDYVRFMME
ncbi:MAG: N-acetylmuramoyl-L-alanine amidase [Lewinella sp.]|nr:N-acetylmuramoyl-L-alanine amidase [Lewinella sp.]